MDPARILRRARLSRLRVLHCTNDMPRSFLTIRSTCRVLIAWRSAMTVSGTIRLTGSSMIALTERWWGSGMGKSSTAKVLSSASSASLSGLRSLGLAARGRGEDEQSSLADGGRSARRTSALLVGASLLLIGACAGPSDASGNGPSANGSETRVVATDQGRGRSSRGSKEGSRAQLRPRRLPL